MKVDTIDQGNGILSFDQSSNFELVCEILAENIPVFKYRSIKTGLHVILAKVEGPIVNGYFTIGTEAHDDDGLPHTLEHLIFMGSEDYPYKGVLDLLANRCLADGTNAWTAVDHTAYTVMTGGSEGFLNLLPIYLDHLLYPTLLESTFKTEVYHMTGQAEDAGVVFCEMQARENTGSSRTFIELFRGLYPGKSGYRSETGGIMENLRCSTTNEKIRAYHKAMYNPENLHVIITGQVEPNEVFKALTSVENKIIAKGDNKGNVRPWQSPSAPMLESKDIEVLYPSDNEGTGIVRVGWRGPNVITERKEYVALEILLTYLTESSVSPVKKAFIEISDPLASAVKDYLAEYPESAVMLMFSGVPKEKISLVKPLLEKTLEDVSNDGTPFESKRMQSIIRNFILKEKSKLESCPHDTLADNIIVDLLYGNSKQDMCILLSKKKMFETLLLETSSFWQNICQNYLVGKPCAVVRGVPSIQEATRLQEQDKTRVEERKKNLGAEGLKDLEIALEKAKQANEVEPPKEVLTSVPIPSVHNQKWHSLNVSTNIEQFKNKKQNKLRIDVDKLNFKMHVDQINSNFVQIISIIDTSSLVPAEKDYLQLLLELLLESPLRREGEFVSHEDVIKNLTADTIKAEAISGLRLYKHTFSIGPYFNNITVNLKVEMNKYEKGVKWLRDILFNVVFDAERIKVKANMLINSVGEIKKSANAIVKIMYNDVVFKKDSYPNRGNALRQENFLNQLLADLELNSTKVINQITDVYKKISQPNGISLHVSSNFEKLSQKIDPTTPWLNFLPESAKISNNFSLNAVLDNVDRLSWDEKSSSTGSVAGMGSVESAYLLQVTDSIDSHSHPDLPALMVAVAYLTQLEGPMWREIRGKGLSYSYGLDLEPSSGTLTLRLARAAQLGNAYVEAVRIIKSYIDGGEPWDSLLFESGRSSLIYEVIAREGNISDVVQQSLYAYYRGVPTDYNRLLLEDIANVSISDMSTAAKKYFTPLLDPTKSRAVIVCPPPHVEKLLAEMSNVGHKLERVEIVPTASFARL